MKKNYSFKNGNSQKAKKAYTLLSYFALTFIALSFFSNNLFSQTTVFTDDFNSNLTSYISPSQGGTPKATYTTGTGSNGAISYRVWTAPEYGLQIAGSGTAGNSFTYLDNSVFTHPYSSSAGLHASSGLISWYFNFRNYGNSSNYKSAIILACSSSDFNSASATGYAVYYNKTTARRFSLAKFSAGVLGTSVTDVIPELGSDDLASATNQNYSSVKVTYDPATDNWSLYVRDDGSSFFTTPWTGTTLAQHGSSVVDATYTTPSDNLKYSGFYYKYNTGTSGTYKATFDNFKVTQIATSAPTTQSSNLVFSPIAINTLTATWTNGNGGKRIVVMNTSNSFTAPVNGVEPVANAVYSGSGEQVVYNGTGNTVNISGLTQNTQYWLRIYDYSYGSSLSPIYQTAISTNNPLNVTTLGSIIAPTVSTPTATAITNNTVTLGGNITSDGGAAITDRGTVWKTASGVTISDNFLSEAGTSTGVFTQPRTGLPSKSLIYYAAYATNSVGTSLSPEGSFYTKADEPTSTVGSFAANPVTEYIDYTHLILTWTPATGADGYFITQRVGTSAGGTSPSDGLAYTVGNILGTGTVCAIVPSGNTTSVIITGLISGTAYTFRIYPFAWDGSNAQTYNYAGSLSADATGTPPLGTILNSVYQKFKVIATSNSLIINGAKNQNITLSLLTGQIIHKGIINSDNETIQLKNGFYILSIGNQKYKLQINSK
jgi:hypothetical protein